MAVTEPPITAPPEVPPPVPCLALLGPTACGKSEAAMALAQELDGEIVSCDSMQVYRGLDIGTAKPSVADRRRVVHHLVDILDIHQPWDVSRFVQAAARVLAAIWGRGRLPILVGGSGLYAKALIYGYHLQPAAPHVAGQIASVLALPGGRERLVAELLSQARAPIPPQVLRNPRQLIRAVEILRLTGQYPRPAVPLHQNQLSPSGFQQFVVAVEPRFQRQLIAERTHAMLAAGWVEETRQLVLAGLLRTPTARQALGYREIAAFLDAGPSDIPLLAQRLVERTAQYARRQRTWFRHQHPDATAVELNPGDTPRCLAGRILSQISAVRPPVIHA